MNEYIIRTATREEVDLAVEWAAQEGWNPGLHDAACYYAADPGGFLIGLLDGEPIAMVSSTRYGETFGFAGFYIVKPAYRGQGYGLQIAQTAMERLAGRNIGLDGVVEQQENYKKSGFKLAYRNVRYAGNVGGPSQTHPDIVALASLPYDILATYERPFFPVPRDAFLKAWISQPDSTAVGIMDSGTLAGYGVIRACRTGHKIGPLYADSPELAESLFYALISTVKATASIYLDVPAPNEDAVALAKRNGMTMVFETARMYSGDAPCLPLKRIFGVSSFEIG